MQMQTKELLKLNVQSNSDLELNNNVNATAFVVAF